MKLNLSVRAKNPVFWVQLIGAIVLPVLAYFKLTVQDFTTWGMVWETIVKAVQNPYVVGTMLWAAWGVLNDPTTAGVVDSDRAMTYTKPSK